MKIAKIVECLDAEVLTGNHNLNEEIEYAYSCDLMSDVLAYVIHNVILLTGLIHPQVIRTAEMLDIKFIVFVRGKVPSEEVLRMAKTRDITIICTKYSMFTASGILHQNGLIGEECINEITLHS